MKHSRRSAGLVPILMALLWPQVSSGSDAWTLVYSVRGGIGGSDRRLELTDSGALTAGNSNTGGSRVTTHASAELMARIAAFLKIARAARPASGAAIPDALYTSLTLRSAGGTRELEIPEDLQRLLTNTADSLVRQGFIGTWWQSGWKLCQPVEKLTAEDVDPPVERLVFESNGHYSVTWRGGGTRVYGDPDGKVPHADLPDYVGEYSLLPEYSSIHLALLEGLVRLHPVRDFSGNGHFRINGDTLILQGLWLGTYQAKHKPDICELTFTRAAATNSHS